MAAFKVARRSGGRKKRRLQAAHGCLSANRDYDSVQIQSDDKIKWGCCVSLTTCEYTIGRGQLGGSFVLSDTALCCLNRESTSVCLEMTCSATGCCDGAGDVPIRLSFISLLYASKLSLKSLLITRFYCARGKSILPARVILMQRKAANTNSQNKPTTFY